MAKLYVTTRTQTIQPTFIANVKDKLLWLGGFIIGIVILPVGVVVLLLLVLFMSLKQEFDQYILGKVNEDETSVAVWVTLFQSETITIESMEIYAEEEFDNINWADFILMKLRANPMITQLEDLYFLEEYIVFANHLILLQVEKDDEPTPIKVVQLDLITFELTLLEAFDEHWDRINFNLLDQENLIILFEQGLNKIEMQLQTKP